MSPLHEMRCTGCSHTQQLLTFKPGRAPSVYCERCGHAMEPTLGANLQFIGEWETNDHKPAEPGGEGDL